MDAVLAANVARSLRLRLVAYTPGGAKMGELPDVLELQHSRVHNSLPTLTFTYSIYGRRSDWLDQEFLEIAVEWNDGTVWREDTDSRFLLMSSDRNEVEETQVVKYTCYGYGWLLNKAPLVTTVANSPDNVSRRFNNQTTGSILATLINEAKARDWAPDLTYAFTSAVDSAGNDWVGEDFSISLDRGTTVFSVLDNFARQGLVDYRFQGRNLIVFNAGNEVIAPRANPKRISTTTEINPLTFMNSVTSVSTSGAATHWKDGTEGGQIKQDILALAQNGRPNWTSQLLTEFRSGVWQGATSREVATYLTTDVVDSDGMVNAWGYWIADVNEALRYCLIVEDPGDASAIALAYSIFQARGGGIVFINQAEIGSYLWYRDSANGPIGPLHVLIQKGLPIIQIGRFTSDYKTSSGTNAAVIVETGQAKHDSVNDRFAIRLPQQTGLISILDVNDKHTLGLASYNDREAGDKAKLNHVSYLCRAYGTPFARLSVKSSWLDNSTNRGKITTAVATAINDKVRVRLARVAPKASEDPNFPNPGNGLVDLRFGRDIVAANVQRTLEDYTHRVYSYGDGFSKTTVENADSPTPWGKWETVLGVGGVDTADNLDDLAYSTLLKGSATKVSMSRDITVQTARYYPYRDYDHGDILMCQTTNNLMLPYQVQQIVINKNVDNTIDGNLTMADAWEPAEEKRNRAIMSAAGTTGGSRTGGTGVSPSTPIPVNLKPQKPVWS